MDQTWDQKKSKPLNFKLLSLNYLLDHYIIKVFGIKIIGPITKKNLTDSYKIIDGIEKLIKISQ